MIMKVVHRARTKQKGNRKTTIKMFPAIELHVNKCIAPPISPAPSKRLYRLRH